MEHIAPDNNLVDTESLNNVVFQALSMMEENKKVFIMPNSDDLTAIYVEDNTVKLNLLKEQLLKEPSYVSLISKANPSEFKFSLYSLLATEFLLTGRPGDGHLLIADIINAIKEKIITLKDGLLKVAHLQILYPNGFYSLEGYKKRVNEHQTGIVTEIV